MQTFLPYPDFTESARCLDSKRLGKQRVEARQILKTLLEGGAWRNHPAVLMWRGYEPALADYGDTIILEWIKRGYQNKMELIFPGSIVLPPWFANDRFHASHRSNLLRKDYNYYSKFGWQEGTGLPYWWPIRKG